MVLGGTPLEALLESIGVAIDHKDSALSLRSSRDHIGNEVLVAGGVNYSKVLVGSENVSLGSVDSDTSAPFFFVLIHEESEVEGTFAVGLGQLFLFGYRVIVDFTHLVQQVPHQGTLAGVDVADDNHVHLALRLFLVYFDLVVEWREGLVEGFAIDLLEFGGIAINFLQFLLLLHSPSDVVSFDLVLGLFNFLELLLVFDFDFLLLVALASFLELGLAVFEHSHGLVHVIFILNEGFVHLRKSEVVAEVQDDALHHNSFRLNRLLFL
mmetsp:Transcript_26242/g.40051  ORF Transcript_26242/g.40051 Transcript_26242/m.40051 type:complete len:267 (-) Transcript_26242:304-1104(-)